MEDNNLFEGVKFADRYQTRDGRTAVFLNWDQYMNKVFLYVKERDMEDYGEHSYYLNGKCDNGNPSLDIVLRIEDVINATTNSITNREEEIIKEAQKYQDWIVSNNPSAEAYDYFNAFVHGAAYADSHPNGFINYEPKKTLTNKEFIELLKQFPENANVCVECCNPRAMIYDEENNLIRID